MRIMNLAFGRALAQLCILASSALGASGQGISLVPPPGWVQGETSMAGVLLQFRDGAAKDAQFKSNVVVARSPMACCREETTPPDSLIAKVEGQQRRVFPMYKVLEKSTRIQAGKTGGMLVSSYAQGARDLACFQFFYLDGQDFTNVVYTCPLADFKRLRPEFEKSLSTLQSIQAARPQEAKPGKSVKAQGG